LPQARINSHLTRNPRRKAALPDKELPNHRCAEMFSWISLRFLNTKGYDARKAREEVALGPHRPDKCAQTKHPSFHRRFPIAEIAIFAAEYFIQKMVGESQMFF
jgi:hypothetical protein